MAFPYKRSLVNISLVSIFDGVFSDLMKQSEGIPQSVNIQEPINCSSISILPNLFKILQIVHTVDFLSHLIVSFSVWFGGL